VTLKKNSVSERKTKDGHKLVEAQCKECGFIRTDRYQRIKDDLVSVCTHTQEYKICLCLYCGKEIPVGNLKPSEYNGRKFCNNSCAASYNNLHKERDKKRCLNCGKEIPKRNKYCSHKCQHEYQQIVWEQKWLNGEINGNGNSIWLDTSDRLRTYLFKKYNNKCSQCGWKKVNSYTGNIPLEIHHIDGNPYNSSPDNVTLLCPNCHSLTNNYKSMNRGNGRKKTWMPFQSNDINNTA
jgi:predicted nucleic acid-binding Zn ribbon protein